MKKYATAFVASLGFTVVLTGAALHEPLQPTQPIQPIRPAVIVNPPFQQVFGTQAVSITKAIAAFVETLVTPNARFDKWLTGDQPSFSLPVLPPSSDQTPRPTPFADVKRAGR